MKTHESVKATDGSGRDVCLNCLALLNGSEAAECKPREDGLSVDLYVGGVEVFNIWKHYGIWGTITSVEDVETKKGV